MIEIAGFFALGLGTGVLLYLVAFGLRSVIKMFKNVIS